MQKIENDIKSGNFERVYLLFGEEEYLCKFYKSRLKKAINGTDDDMNCSVFENAFERANEIIDVADTLPFFADRRLIIVENSGFFKKENPLTEYLGRVPETTVFIFVDSEVDKRSKMFKAVKQFGYPCEMKRQGINELKVFCGRMIVRAGKQILDSTCDYFVNSIGNDMNMLMNETEKLIAYAGDRKEITAKDVNAVCSMQIENKIFDMVDAIILHDKTTVMRLYGSLLALRENPFGMLALIRKNYNRLYTVSEMLADGAGNTEIAAKAKIPDWSVKKYRNQLRNYNTDKILAAIQATVDAEQAIKLGNISDQMGLEILLAKLMTI